MELSSLLASPYLIFLVAILTLVAWYRRHLTRLPPGPFQWPIVGCLPQLMLNSSDLFAYYASLVKKYGGIFSFKVGGYQSVFIADRQLMKEAFVKQAECFNTRFDDNVALSIFTNPKGHGITGGQGALWKKTRRFVAVTLRDMGVGKKSLEETCRQECQRFIDNLQDTMAQPTDPQALLGMAVSNVISSISFGSRYEYDDPWFVHMNRSTSALSHQSSFFSMDNLFPVFKYLPLSPTMRRYQAVREDVAKHLNDEIGKHRKSFKIGTVRDLVDLYLEKEMQQDPEEVYSRENLHQVLIDLMVGGSDVTACTMRWIMLYLAIYPEIQIKCFDEIEKVLDKQRLPVLEDRNRLPNMEAIYYEVMRHSHVAPTSLAHAATYETELGGYTIPKGTVVYPYLQAAMMDEACWHDAKSFRPERFLNATGTCIDNSQLAKMVAFGVGPRSCPGESLAKMELFLFVTSVLQKFTISLPPEYQPFDLRPVMGFVCSPKPHKLIFKPR